MQQCSVDLGICDSTSSDALLCGFLLQWCMTAPQGLAVASVAAAFACLHCNFSLTRDVNTLPVRVYGYVALPTYDIFPSSDSNM